MRNGKIIGTGIDLVENERMRAMLARWDRPFKDRVFLPAEQAYCDDKAQPWLYYSGRFAVKEAVAKAFGTGIGPSLGWLDVEVVRDQVSGAPSVRLSDHGLELARKMGVGRTHISLSHTHNFSIAQAILEADGQT